MPSPPRYAPPVLLLLTALLLLGVAACHSGVSNADVSRYMQADARPSDPSTRVQFGRGHLPNDFPAGIPTVDRATLLGWIRTTSDTAYSWEAVYEAPGDPSRIAGVMTDRLNRGGWQVNDRADRNGFIALNFTGSGKNDGRTGVLDVGPAVTSGRVQLIVEIGEDRRSGG